MPARARTSLLLVLLLLVVPSATADAPAHLALDLGGEARLELVLIKKGTFKQGSLDKEPGRGEDETGREVTLSQDFYLGKYPVTRGQFDRFVRDTGCKTEAEKGTSGGFGLEGGKLVQHKDYTWRHPGFKQTDEHPVCLVTYDDARAFTAWLARKSKRAVDLPTEAQWEYACRAGTTTRFYSGDTDESARDIGWLKANAGDGTRLVGLKKPNAFGLYDMCGNVHQWCRDWYAPYKPGPVTDPEMTQEPGIKPARRVLRGGSFLREVHNGRSAARSRNTPGSRNADNGFRIVIPLEGGPGAGAQRPLSVTQLPLAASTVYRLLTGGVFCFLLLVGASILLVILVLRQRSSGDLFSRRRGQAGTAADLDRLRPRVVDDGFWIEAPWLARGSRLRYRYRAGGSEKTSLVTFEPGPEGHFVYTGDQPTDIRFLEILPPETVPGASFADLDSRSDDSDSWRSSPLSSSSSAEPFSGYPSAY